MIAVFFKTKCPCWFSIRKMTGVLKKIKTSFFQSRNMSEYSVVINLIVN